MRTDQNFQATGRSGCGLYEQKYPVLTRVARWVPSEGMASRISLIEHLIRLVTAERARSAAKPILRFRPPSPTAEASCWARASISSRARSARVGSLNRSASSKSLRRSSKRCLYSTLACASRIGPASDRSPPCQAPVACSPFPNNWGLAITCPTNSHTCNSRPGLRSNKARSCKPRLALRNKREIARKPS